MNNQCRILIAILILCYMGIAGAATFQEMVTSLKSLVVRSIRQSVDSKQHLRLEGDVELVVDDIGRVWADEADIDIEKKEFVAQSPESGFLSLETNDFVLLADRVWCNFEERLCEAEGLKMHLGSRKLSAKKARRTSDDRWILEDVVFTGCECPTPHWSITADEAILKGDMLNIRGLYFRINGWRVLGIPRMFFPKPHHSDSDSVSQSGFMMPKFTIDKRLGLSIHQAYYLALTDNMDSTLGAKWYDKKGFVIYDEFRRATGPEKFTLFNAMMTREKNADIQRDNRIVLGQRYRYWIDGVHYQNTTFSGVPIYHLLRLDFGTDKKIGYEFFTKTDAIEDVFFNILSSRYLGQKNYVEGVFDHDLLRREQFMDAGDLKKEQEDRYFRIRTPHVRWYSAFSSFFNLMNIRHTLQTDYVFFYWLVCNKLYKDNEVIVSGEEKKLPKGNMFRLNYAAHFEQALKLWGATLGGRVIPHADVRSNRSNNTVLAKKGALSIALGSGVFRMFLEAQGYLALPQMRFIDPKSDLYTTVQPEFYVSYIPKFRQDQWFFIDYMDRVFPSTRFGLKVYNHWGSGEINCDFNADIAYELRDMSEIFPLERAREQTHYMPIKFDALVYYKGLSLSTKYEWDLPAHRLIHAGIDADFTLDHLHLHLGWVFYDDLILRRRGLLSDIPSFGLLGVGVDLLDGLRVTYDNELHAKEAGVFGLLRSAKLFSQRFAIDYTGHCFHVGLGIEDRRFRQQGNLRSEYTYFFSINLTGLGSFFKRFKMDPQTILSKNSI